LNPTDTLTVDKGKALGNTGAFAVSIGGYEMRVFDYICVVNPEDAVRGLDWQEIETREQKKPTHSRYVGTMDGIEIWYDYGADYYFFVDITE
jgi:hypothetical protein